MAKNFASLAFTPEVKALQEKYGSRSGYDHVEKRMVADGFTPNEIRFIGERDSLYMASIGENGFPYIQHRGGPKGFVKVLDPRTLGFIDFSGNKQFITMGNVATNKNVSLIMVDYPQQARLKIYARAEVADLRERPDLLKTLSLNDYTHKPERIILLHVEAYDWNCPQHITPRYTAEEIEEVLGSQKQYIKGLEDEIKELRNRK